MRSGDTLAAIAGRFGMAVTALATANSLANPNFIRSGQILVIAPLPDQRACDYPGGRS